MGHVIADLPASDYLQTLVRQANSAPLALGSPFPPGEHGSVTRSPLTQGWFTDRYATGASYAR